MGREPRGINSADPKLHGGVVRAINPALSRLDLKVVLKCFACAGDFETQRFGI